ncbi:efflux RND transporter periplasmic adaptor subunit [Kaarinaea lacus]
MNFPLRNFFLWIISVIVLSTSSLALAAEYDAVIDWHRKIKLSTPVSGVVAKVAVQVGDRVNKGDVLLQLDNAVIQSKAEEAKARTAYLERVHAEAQRELDRNIELYDRTVLSDHELENAHIAFADAEFKLKTAYADREQADFDLRHSIISAPFNGVVISRNANEGETIISEQSAPVLIELGETDVMVAEMQLSLSQVSSMKKGLKAAVVVGKNRYPGEVDAVGFEPSGKKSARTYTVRVVFKTLGRIFRAGQTAKVDIP